MDIYRKVWNKVYTLNVWLKKKCHTNKIVENKGNMKKSWKLTNSLLNKPSKSTNITIIKDGTTEILEKREISNILNSYFCSVGEELTRNIDEASNSLLTGSYTINDSNSSFKVEEINGMHIRDAISKIETLERFGTDNISSYFLKLALPFINKSLVYIFNTSMQIGVFPSQWKTARVTPIFKEGDKSAKTNYQLISVLPVISHLFKS